MNRIYHTWDKWECYREGFFEVHPPKGMTEDECHEKYRDLLLDIPQFKAIMRCILRDWPNSVEHNLTNERMNRIAWMGQAALAYRYRIPARFRGGYNLLSVEEQQVADQSALEVINEWMYLRGYELLETTIPKTEVNLY